MSHAFRGLVRVVLTNLVNGRRTLAMAKVELFKRYSGSALGVFWSLARPMLFVAVYWFAIQVGLRGGLPVEGTPFFFWFLPAIMCWFFVSDALVAGGTSIRRNSHLVTKVVFPAATIPTFTVISYYFVHLALMSVTLGIFALSGQGLSVYAFQLIYYGFCALMFVLVLSAFLSAMTVVSQDVAHMVKSTMTVLFWVTPIIWPLSRLGGRLKLVIMMNPVCYLTQGYRNSLVLERWFFQEWQYMIYFWLLLAGLALVTGQVFERLERDFADIL